MIFVTGDTHEYLTCKALFRLQEEYPNLTKKDYLIIAGDYGGCFNLKLLKETEDLMKKLSYTILFVDGNHENFEILNSYEISTWCGGKVHKLFPDVIHLMRGEIFTIENKKILAFGGAESTDKNTRIPHLTWWEEETITFDDVDNALNNLAKVNNEVDFVITHTCPSHLLFNQYLYPITHAFASNSERMLENVSDGIIFQKWYFGHYHLDIDFKNRYRLIYQDYERIN